MISFPKRKIAVVKRFKASLKFLETLASSSSLTQISIYKWLGYNMGSFKTTSLATKDVKIVFHFSVLRYLFGFVEYILDTKPEMFIYSAKTNKE